MGPSSFEFMFEHVDGAGLLAEMAGAERAERMAVARRLLAAGRLCQRQRTAMSEMVGVSCPVSRYPKCGICA